MAFYAVNVREHQNRKEVAVKDAVVAAASVTNCPQFPEVWKSLQAVLECELWHLQLSSERNPATSPVEGLLTEQDFVYL